MIPYERQQLILDLLKGKDLVKLDELAEHIPDVSKSTLRRDIKELEANNLVKSLSGGAVKEYGTISELPISAKATMHTEEKKRIARLAAGQIHAHDTIYLDSGSTCSALLGDILDMDIHIVTTNTDILRTNAEAIKAEIILVGGIYNSSISSLYGPLALENIKKYIFDVAFLGANGVDLHYGVTTPHLEEAAKKQAVAENARATFLLCDSTKFHKVSSVKTLELEQVTIISDKNDGRLAERTRILFE